MDRVFTELTPECEITARMYAQGYEKKEIANLKCRAVSTVNNQLQKAFDVLQVRNGRELATMLYERIAGVKFTMDFHLSFVHPLPVAYYVSFLCRFTTNRAI